MLFNKQEICQDINFPPKSIINDKIYLFLYSLISKIFLLDKKTNSEHFENCINKINNEIIKVKSRYITIEYTINNLKNIFLFIKGQNKIFADDIIEGLLIIVFSSTFKNEINYPLEKYIYMDKDKKECNFYKSGNYEIIELFDSKKLFPDELQNLKNLLEEEDKYEDDDYNDILEESPFYGLLNEIQNFKLGFCNEKNKNRNKNLLYKNNLVNQKDFDELFLYKSNNKKLIRLFLISVYIYSHNKNSSFMQYVKEKTFLDKNNNIKNLCPIPFNYDLSFAYLTNIFSNSIFSPIKIEPKISVISLSHNDLGNYGFFNLAKTLIFNKNIEKCDLNNSNLNLYNLKYFSLGFGIFDNYTLKELNLSCNEINKETGKYLYKVLSHLKGLKLINLSGNNLKRGAVSFILLLKELYCQNKINLETLILDKCDLDNSSFYELGELLKSPFCGLKKLFLNKNIIQDNDNFLKKLKMNKSLEELYLNSTNINDNDINNIIKLINNTHIQVLYLYNNLLSNLDDLIRIIYTTKIVRFNSNNNQINKNNDIMILNEQSFLENLDLSNNRILNKNEEGVKLLNEIKNQTNLSCLDLSHILYGIDPNKFEKNDKNKKYVNAVDKLKKEIENDKEAFINNKLIKTRTKIDIKRGIEKIKNLEEYLLKNFKKEIISILDNKINEVNLENIKLHLELKGKIKNIIFDLAKKNSEIKNILVIKDNKENKTLKLNYDAYKNIENYLFHKVLLKQAEKQLEILDKNEKERKLFII